ncbi:MULTISPECIES: hypothetical protein [unclassified Nostoc]|uniref:hypothetical protein n=1 Tax=unclassified Nostoc TaxID=2593658 RepID=UPI0025CDAB9C|nr:hypothetical protein [Nostoc sp. JL23]
MALVRWEPFREVESLQRQLNRLLDEIAPTGRRGEEGIGFIPSAEIEETPDAGRSSRCRPQRPRCAGVNEQKIWRDSQMSGAISQYVSRPAF